MYPGFTTVTATPLGPNSALRESKYPCRACLEAESRREREEREKRERREGGERKKREERGRREGEEREKRGRREVLAVLAPNSCLMGDKHSSSEKKAACLTMLLSAQKVSWLCHIIEGGQGHDNKELRLSFSSHPSQPYECCCTVEIVALITHKRSGMGVLSFPAGC